MVMGAELLSTGEIQEVVVDRNREALCFPVGVGAVEQMPEDADQAGDIEEDLIGLSMSVPAVSHFVEQVGEILIPGDADFFEGLGLGGEDGVDALGGEVVAALAVLDPMEKFLLLVEEGVQQGLVTVVSV